MNPLVRARDLVLKGAASEEELVEILEEAGRSRLLKATGNLKLFLRV